MHYSFKHITTTSSGRVSMLNNMRKHRKGLSSSSPHMGTDAVMYAKCYKKKYILVSISSTF